MSDEFRLLGTQMLLQRVAKARAQGDWRSAKREWEACIARASQRVTVVVDTYVAKGWIPTAEREDVVQDALVRGARKLVDNLDSLDENVFFAGMVTVADFQCRDAGRRYMKRQQREKPLDAPGAWGDDAPGRYDRAAASEAEEHWRREEEVLEATARIESLIPRLRDERAHKIFTLHRLGVKDPQIAEEVGISVANLHTIRSRALKELRGMIDP